MAPILILAASLVAAFVLWYACSLVPGSIARGLARAAFIAVLCSPGLLVGHGIAVVPSLFALAVQPSIFTLGSMLLVWLIATGVILAVPGLRAHRSPWPPALEEVVLAAYPVKFAFFGLVAALLMLALLFADHHSTIWVLALQYGMLFTGAALNWMLCCVAVRRHRAAPVLTPLAFAAPALPAAAPIVFLVWYAGGLIGGLVGGGRRRTAAWTALGAFALLLVNALFRTYAAATAPAHVVIQGGVAGNALMAGLYALAGIVAWALLRVPARGDAVRPPVARDDEPG